MRGESKKKTKKNNLSNFIDNLCTTEGSITPKAKKMFFF